MQCERTTVSSAPPPKCRSFSRYTTGSGCPTLAGECASSGSSTTVSWACQLSVESIGSSLHHRETSRGLPAAGSLMRRCGSCPRPCLTTRMSRETRLGGGRESEDRSSSRSEEHTSELQSHSDLVCRLLLEK